MFDSPRRGFARSEALALAAVIAVIAAVLVPCMEKQRRLARLGEDLAKMKSFGVATGSYAADNGDAFCMFSWRGSPEHPSHYSKYNDLNGDTTDVAAEASQAVDILRRVAGREDMPKISSWFCPLLYSHLVLAEYMGTRLPNLDAVSAADPRRLDWARDPAKFDKGGFGNCQPPPSGINKRWPYSSSFMRPPAVYGTPSGSNAITTGGSWVFIVPPECEMFGRPVSSVAFPSQKVQLFDGRDRHTGTNRMVFLAPEARTTMLMVDGAAAWRASGDANPGWQPQDPGNPDPTIVTYIEGSDECDPPKSTYTGPALYFLTRGALAGRDFGGPEAP